MARYGENKPVQRNKDNVAGDKKPNRSPGQSNANRALPSLREDVRASQSRDAGRIVRGLDATGKGAARTSQQQAAARAITRTASRAGLAGAALATGYQAGKEIDKATGIGRKAVDKMPDGLFAKPGVKLSKDSEKRLSDERIKKVGSVAVKDKEEPKKADKEGSVKKTGNTAFGKAFREARDEGKDKFTFGGKKYHTKTKEEVGK
jgi:hypothetical protein